MAIKGNKIMKASLKNKEKDQVDSQLKMAVDSTTSVKTPAYWESTLFSEVYLNNDLKRDFEDRWNRDYDDAVFDEEGNHVKSGFAHFYNEFRNIASTLRKTANTKNLKETNTISKIIIPLLDALGWYDKCFVNGEEPFDSETSFTVKGKGGEANKVFRSDMLLVDDPSEALFISDPKNNDKRKKEARSYCIVPLEAKYWSRISDKEGGLRFDRNREDTSSDDTGASWSFNEQILNYMDILNKKWGIITDGNTWRLVHSDVSGESPQRCFEFKIESLLSKELKIKEGSSDNEEFIENAKLFYLFFGKPSYVKDDVGKVFLDEVLTKSRKYIDTIEEDLKNRFISTMNMTCDGLLRVAKEKGTIVNPTKEELALIRTVAESHLFNILFIKSCEANKVLDPKIPGYYDISLTNIIDRIKVFHPENYCKDRDYINRRLASSLKRERYNPIGTSLYKYLISLTEGLRDGIEKFKITGFVESVFSKKEWSFAKKHPLTDEEMVQIFFQLGYSKSEKAYQDDYQQIPYNYFTPRQLGSIYESFLEYRLKIAEYSMVYIERGKKKKYMQWIKLTASIQGKLKGHEPIVKKGQLFFTPDNSERKATGSYYTPDYIVQYMAKETIAPLCEGKTSDEILEIKICDPAMGSGHFLIGVLNLLTRKYLMALEREKPEEELPTLEQAKRIVLRRCIYGVDINSRAVKLAKMSLWLESAYSGKELEKLDDQLISGNSLLPETCWSEHNDMRLKAFDAVVGNPPYLRATSIPKELRELCRKEFVSAIGSYDLFVPFVEHAIRLLKPGGRFGQIVSNKICVSDYSKKIREILVQDNTVDVLIDFTKATKVFDAASVVPVIVVGSQRESLGENIVNYGTPKDEDILDLNSSLSGVSIKEILGDSFSFELFKDSQDKNLISIIYKDSILLDSYEKNIRTGIMGFEYWDHEPFVKSDKQGIAGGKGWKLITPGLFGSYENVWESKKLNLYKKSFTYPVLQKNNSLLSDQTRNLFDSKKVVIRGVGKGICSFYDTESVATLVGVHSVVNPMLPFFMLTLFNSLLVDWIYATKLLGGKIPQGSLKYPVSFIKSIPIKTDGLDEVEAQLKSILKKGKITPEKMKAVNKVILNHYGIPEKYWRSMEDKVKEHVNLEYSLESSKKVPQAA